MAEPLDCALVACATEPAFAARTTRVTLLPVVAMTCKGALRPASADFPAAVARNNGVQLTIKKLVSHVENSQVLCSAITAGAKNHVLSDDSCFAVALGTVAKPCARIRFAICRTSTDLDHHPLFAFEASNPQSANLA